MLNDGTRFWAAAAAACWEGPEVERFLRACAAGPSREAADAARDVLNKRYRTWRPL